MADPSFIVGILGNVISILVFASPISTFRRIVKNKSTENFKWLPYATTLLSTSLWTFYGLLKPGGLLVVTVNGAGTVLEAIYVLLYLYFASKDTKWTMAKLVAVVNIGFLALVILLTLLLMHGSIRLLVVGILCAALTIRMYASPMGAMSTVVRTKSVEYMPFSLSFFLFLNAGIWSVYSVLVKDYFIGVPNAIGFALGSAQLILYMIYRRKGPQKENLERDEEEGSAHLMGRVEMSENKHLHKGSSLPKSFASRQSSSSRILKAFSMTPLELHSLTDKKEKHLEVNTQSSL